MATAADIIAGRLHDAGVRFAYGIPGGETLALMDALGRAGIQFRLCKHENAGGFMAEGAHHATLAPAVLLATIGPGVANAVNVVANAYQDQVPMIFLTGCVDAADALTYTHQVFDHGRLLESVTKGTLVAAPGAVDVAIDKAVAIATDDPPGPVHVDVPIAVAKAEQPGPRSNAPLRRARPSPMAPAPGPDLDAARKVLKDAKRPLMIAGIDVLHHDAADTVRSFVKDFSVPLITTYKAKGVLPEDDPLALGAAGLSPLADEHLLPLVGDSDLVILTGYDPIEMRSGWRDPWGPETTVIEFAARPNTHYMHQAASSFIGDVGAGLRALRDGIDANGPWPGGEPKKVRAALRAAFEVDNDDAGDWGAAAVVSAARRALPRDTVASVDSGAHRILLSQMWECYAPRTLLQSTALCTMGVALPMAIGFKAAMPERPVVAFTGDAGLEMVMGELATLRDLALPVAVVVFVDEQLALIELKQRREGLGNVGVDFGATDFPALADALGGVGVTADSRDELAVALTAALSRDTFTVIACPIGAKAYDGKF